MMPYRGVDDKYIQAYMQGQQMRSSSKVPNEWVPAYGIFQVPTNTGRIHLSLCQAEALGVPQDGSAARFDDLGLYLFESREEAELYLHHHLIGSRHQWAGSKEEWNAPTPDAGPCV
ncbi:MAG: hypothetical protein ABIG68_14900 [Acidobacteriota bacterium]